MPAEHSTTMRLENMEKISLRGETGGYFVTCLFCIQKLHRIHSMCNVNRTAASKQLSESEIFIDPNYEAVREHFNGMTSNKTSKPGLDVSLLPSVNTHCSSRTDGLFKSWHSVGEYISAQCLIILSWVELLYLRALCIHKKWKLCRRKTNLIKI